MTTYLSPEDLLALTGDLGVGRAHDALIDGNRRLGWLGVVVFSGLNDVTLEATDDDAHELVTALAAVRPPSRSSQQQSVLALTFVRAPLRQTGIVSGGCPAMR